ncbi:class I SAM-dependent methyltransferase [Streptomyces sp. WM6386]|uniref:class I SAM-dependent methyltransferase n=1 Tax=Streptomyces sp. WM6386 TaxID=1415558 RepID=UPI0006194BD8|nr:class I SAM-dependent methyltransferase [Streptomyces sp. WM6386]
MDDQVSEEAATVFDALGSRYEQAFEGLAGQQAALRWLTVRLPQRARVLDVGSGTGRPVAEELVRAGCEVTGIDVSPAMVELARAQVPEARFELADVRTYEAPPYAFDAVCAFFPLLIMSRAEVESALDRMCGWLAPGGHLVMATVPGDYSDVGLTWMGHRVTVSSLTAEEYKRRLRAQGLEILFTETSTFRPSGSHPTPEHHFFCYAHRPQTPEPVDWQIRPGAHPENPR